MQHQITVNLGLIESRLFVLGGDGIPPLDHRPRSWPRPGGQLATCCVLTTPAASDEVVTVGWPWNVAGIAM